MEPTPSSQDGEYHDNMSNSSYSVSSDRVPKREITVTEPAWMGDSITGHRTYHVN